MVFFRLFHSKFRLPPLPRFRILKFQQHLVLRIEWVSVQFFKDNTWRTRTGPGGRMACRWIHSWTERLLDDTLSPLLLYHLLSIHHHIIPVYSSSFLQATSSFRQQFLHTGSPFLRLITNRFASPTLAEGSTPSSKPTNNIHCSK